MAQYSKKNPYCVRKTLCRLLLTKVKTGVFIEINTRFYRIASGAAGIRTLVQTYPLQAFYMFSFALIVGMGRSKTNQPSP